MASRLAKCLLAASVLHTSTLLASDAPPPQDLNSIITVQAAPPTADDTAACAHRGAAGDAVGLNIQYSGEKPLRGYVVGVFYADAAGRSRYTAVADILNPKETMIAPGKQWHQLACGLSRGASAIEAKTDLLLFDDESCAGPLDLRESSFAYGSLLGLDYAFKTSSRVDTLLATPSQPGSMNVTVSADARPLEFSAVRSYDPDSNLPMLEIRATNKGLVPVVGYEYKISFFEPNGGKFIKSVTTKTLAPHLDKSSLLQPGETWSSGARKLAPASDGSFANYTVTLDAVMLADGSASGPQQSREAVELTGIIAGITSVRGSHPR